MEEKGLLSLAVHAWQCASTWDVCRLWDMNWTRVSNNVVCSLMVKINFFFCILLMVKINLISLILLKVVWSLFLFDFACPRLYKQIACYYMYVQYHVWYNIIIILYNNINYNMFTPECYWICFKYSMHMYNTVLVDSEFTPTPAFCYVYFFSQPLHTNAL